MTLQDDIAQYLRDYGFHWHAADTIITTIAAGLERDNIIISRAEIEAVELERKGEGTNAGSGPEGCYARDSDNPNWLWNHGINALALSIHIESRESESAAAVLQARRDELARELSVASYAANTPMGQRLIDRLITEQDRAAAAEAEVARLKGEGR